MHWFLTIHGNVRSGLSAAWASISFSVALRIGRDVPRDHEDPPMISPSTLRRTEDPPTTRGSFTLSEQIHDL